MNWGSWQEFWSMGGYGGYVWSSYGAAALIVVIEIAAVRARLGRARRALAAGARRGGGRPGQPRA